MKEILNNSVLENIVNKSKFIAHSFSVHSITEIEDILKTLRNNHFDCTHICYAYSLMAGQEKAVDDGEPQGTAGKPILDCIKKSGYTNTMVAVVRYFGGIKLGAGGLVRAYSNSASKVLAISGEKQTTECQKMTFCVSLAEGKQISKLENFQDIKKIEVKYFDKINVEIYFEKQNYDNIVSFVKNIFCREVDFELSDKIYFV